ncbi:MAG: AmmeMemoRadiSam system radical SAM enzyme [Kiritimatiellae bacterium]|nr:AmmeMemoRadiSam system radical SAM enzyme [Kiritimatiellia bacterium]MDD5521231.1 AmmeMemoRadiSam system radical SAM enzyme [Kiritimatiellia bacterium]
MSTAKFWHKLENGRIECDLCPHNCRLSDGKTGLCKVRSVRDGEMNADGYGFVSSVGVDPIEKKPLYHFYPGAAIFSFGGWGCNFACDFCQNWTISQEVDFRSRKYTAAQIVEKAQGSGSMGIAYTYNEPIINFEFVEDCAKLAKSKGLSNVLVTNGYIEPEPAAELLPLIDALNIDIKSIDEEFYKRKCHGSVGPVMAFAIQAVKSGCHVEITNLLIPTLNDDEKLITKLACWIKDNLGENVPLHLSAYHPQYKLSIPVTPLELLEHAYELCRAQLMYVYLGNVWSDTGCNTLCPKCKNILISRHGYDTKITGIEKGTCRKCNRKADIIGL